MALAGHRRGEKPDPNATKRRNARIGLHNRSCPDKGTIGKLVASPHSIQTARIHPAKSIRKEADYFASNAARMDYPSFRHQHLFVGSGVIDAGCRTVSGHRLKQSGMFWTVKGANAILGRCYSHVNGRFEDHSEDRRAA